MDEKNRSRARGPIFIGGLAHSGKTPLRLMLSAHPQLSLTRRTYMWPKFYNQFGDLGQAANRDRCLKAMLASPAIRALQPDADRIRSEFQQGAPTYGRLFALFHEHYAQRLGKRRWGDQLGFVERYAGPIFHAYPDAVIIHMIRDPREQLAQGMSTARYRQGKLGWSTAMWLRSAELSRRNQEHYPDHYKVVRYEALVSRPEQTLSQICIFLGEAFTSEIGNTCLSAVNNGKNGLTAKEITQNGRRLSPRDLLFTQKYTSRHLHAFDYALQPTQLTLPGRLQFYLFNWPANRAGMAAWNVLNRQNLKR